MKKLAISLALLVSAPVFAADLTVGSVLAADKDKPQSITVKRSTSGLAFSDFPMTLSKGVSAGAQDNADGSSVRVAAKHFNSAVVYGGNTAGGSVQACDVSSETKGSDLSAVPAETDKCHSAGS